MWFMDQGQIFGCFYHFINIYWKTNLSITSCVFFFFPYPLALTLSSSHYLPSKPKKVHWEGGLVNKALCWVWSYIRLTVIQCSGDRDRDSYGWLSIPAWRVPGCWESKTQETGNSYEKEHWEAGCSEEVIGLTHSKTNVNTTHRVVERKKFTFSSVQGVLMVVHVTILSEKLLWS